MTVSRGDPTEQRFSCLQLDPSSSHRAPSQPVLQGQEGRQLSTLKEQLPMYLSELCRMSAFVTTSFSSLTRRAMSPQPVEERRGRTPILGVKFHGVCNDYCSSLWKWSTDCGPGTAKCRGRHQGWA
ncbi:hypothetical protein NQZ68_039171, partial [Dissostichus eleginoides]